MLTGKGVASGNEVNTPRRHLPAVSSRDNRREYQSPLFKQVNPADPKQAETEYAQRNPTKRLGLPEEVAKVVAFPLSEESSYLNGQTIAIDGDESNMYGNS